MSTDQGSCRYSNCSSAHATIVPNVQLDVLAGFDLEFDRAGKRWKVWKGLLGHQNILSRRQRDTKDSIRIGFALCHFLSIKIQYRKVGFERSIRTLGAGLDGRTGRPEQDQALHARFLCNRRSVRVPGRSIPTFLRGRWRIG